MRQAAKRKANKERAFEEKESYKWVEGIEAIQEQFEGIEEQFRVLKSQQEPISVSAPIDTRIIHIFDAEADSRRGF